MREVLFIAYYFPPMGGSGVIRAVKLAKYMPRFGWAPVVLTVSKGDSFVFDDTLLHEVPDSVVVERVNALELVRTTQAKDVLDRVRSPGTRGSASRARRAVGQFLRSVYFTLFVPDDKIGWLIPAVNRALKLGQQHSFQAIFATSPPQTDLLIGACVKRRLAIPLVLDYRDEWTTNPHKMMPNRLTLQANRLLERRVVRSADALTVVSAAMRDNLRAAGILADDGPECVVLPNGFDPADFEVGPAGSLAPAKFHIVYTGSFYGNHRVPDPFLYALDRWLHASPQARGDVQVSFLGSIYPRHQRLIHELQLRDVVRVTGLVSHEEAVMAQRSASVLLLIVGRGEGKAVVTGKVFEYLGAERPILAVVPPDGEVAALVRQTRSGIVVDPDETDTAADALRDLYLQWRSGGIAYAPQKGEVAQYSRLHQARQLCEILDRLV